MAALVDRIFVPGCAGEVTGGDSAEAEPSTHPFTVTLGKRTRLKVKPGSSVERELNRCLFAARYVWNWALALEKTQYEIAKADETGETPKRLGQYGLSKRLTALLHGDSAEWDSITIRGAEGKTDDEIAAIKARILNDLQNVSRKMLECELRNLDLAFKAFFRRVKHGETPGYPRFKSRYDERQGVRFISRVSIYSRSVRIPKIGEIAFYEKGYLSETHYKNVRFASIERTAGRWYVSACIDDTRFMWPLGNDHLEIVEARPAGLLVNGERIEMPMPRYLALRRLKRLDRRMSRRDKGSNRRARARIVRARAYARVAAIREHEHHELSTALVKRAKSIHVSSFRVKETIEAEKNRTADKLTDAAYGEFFRQLKYKCDWHGRTYEISVGDDR